MVRAVKKARSRKSKSKSGVRKQSPAQAKKARDLAARKKKFLEVLGSDKAKGFILRACNAMKPKLARDTYYSWYNGDAEFRAAVDRTLEAAVDYAENEAFEFLHNEDIPDAVRERFLRWFLSTRGKDRGYTTKTEIDVHRHDLGVDQEKLTEQFKDAFQEMMKDAKPRKG